VNNLFAIEQGASNLLKRALLKYLQAKEYDMKRMLLAATLGAAAIVGSLAAAPASAAVSVAIGEPGFFGRIDIGGGVPPPQVINTAPVVIAPPAYAVQRAPIYLRVPPGYERDWGRHCGAYNACGQPVYFVRDEWYRDVYARHYREHGDPRRGEYYSDRRGPDRRGPPGHYRDDDRDHRR
jgi:hypothetical protein